MRVIKRTLFSQKLLLTVIYRLLFILLLFIEHFPSPICLGQDIESAGRSLVRKYLAGADGEEQKNIIEELNGRGVGFDKIKEWVRISTDYAPRQSGFYRELMPVGDKKGEYFAYIPSDYTHDRQWPVVLALHGVGGSGYGQLMAWLKSPAYKDDFIFIAPTYGSGLWWNEEGERIVLSAVDKVKQDYNIDTNRIYLTGFSSGGHGVWYLAIRYPSLFAAANPISAECPLPFLLTNLEHVPVYIIHGLRDVVIPVEAARDASSRLEKLNYKVVYKELPDLKHQFPLSQTGEVLDWFRTNKRSLYPKRIKFSTDSRKYSVSYWIEITEFSELVGQVSGVSRDITGRLMKPEGFSETATIEAEVRDEGNEIRLTAYGVKTLRLYLGEDLINMERPLRVHINGKAVYLGKVERSVQTILDTVKKRNDREALFSAYLDIRVPSE